jgi:hypothetical protein
MSTPNIEKIIEQKLAEHQPHKCQTCGWWELPTDIPLDLPYPVAGHCTNPDPITIKLSTCQSWKPKPHLTEQIVPMSNLSKPAVTMDPLPLVYDLKMKTHDDWEWHRRPERVTFGLDIGSGANKLLPVGLDIRPVTDIQADATQIPFPDKYFVIAVLRAVLEHVKDWQKVLKEAERIALDVYVFHSNPDTWDGEYGVWFPLPDNYKPIRKYQYTTLYKKEPSSYPAT